MAIAYKSVSIFFCTVILCGTVYVMEQPVFSTSSLEKQAHVAGSSFERRNALDSQQIDSTIKEAQPKLDQPFLDPFLALAVACKELRRTEQAQQNAQKELNEKQKKYESVSERS